MTERGRLTMVLGVSASVPFAASLLYFVILADTVLAQPIYTAAKIFTIAWPLLAWCLFLRRRVVWRLHPTRHIGALPLGIFSGILLSVPVLLVMRTPLAALALEAADDIRLKTEQLGIIENYWLFAVFLSVLHSLIEEYYWRWFVYGRLRERIGAAKSIALAALAFALHHLVVTSQFFPFAWAIAVSLIIAAAGAVWCWMYERQGNIAGAWISHMLVDFALMWVGYGLITQ